MGNGHILFEVWATMNFRDEMVEGELTPIIAVHVLLADFTFANMTDPVITFRNFKGINVFRPKIQSFDFCASPLHAITNSLRM